jgi:hypothetical protein
MRLVILVFFVFILAVRGEPVLWDPAVGGNGHFYQTIYAPNGINWADANTAAIAAGGYLCTITSTAENNFVAALINKNHRLFYNAFSTTVGPWIGGFQPPGSQEPDGGWSWVTGETWSFTAWAPGEPNNNGNEDHVMFYESTVTTNVTHWNDGNGNSLLNGYVIEFNSVPTISNIRISEVEISWQSVSNTSYRIEYRSDLTSNSWVTLTNANCITGDGGALRVYDKIPVGEPQRFFHVMLGETNCGN